MARQYIRETEKQGMKKGTKFTEATLFAIAKDLQNGKSLMTRANLSDDMVTGLRYTVLPSGSITLSANYFVGQERCLLKLGVLNKGQEDYISIEDARELTKTIKALGDKGVNPQDGLTKRLIRELKEKGTAWRPK
jgi:hypothetical protein